MGLAFLYVFTYSIPVALSIGLILYGTIMILKQKNFITDKSNRNLKIISNLFLYVGLALFILYIAILIIFRLMMNNFSIISILLLNLSFFLLSAGFSIPHKPKKETTISKNPIAEKKVNQ
jgi:hypothetical protein